MIDLKIDFILWKYEDEIECFLAKVRCELAMGKITRAEGAEFIQKKLDEIIDFEFDESTNRHIN